MMKIFKYGKQDADWFDLSPAGAALVHWRYAWIGASVLETFIIPDVLAKYVQWEENLASSEVYPFCLLILWKWPNSVWFSRWMIGVSYVTFWDVFI